jgi:hypothetical protein
MPRYVVVAFLEPMTVGGEFSRRRWPMHVTVSTNFDLEASDARVLDLLAPVVAGVRRFVASPGEPAGFGSRGDVPVALAEPGERWRQQHDAHVGVIRDAGGRMVHPQWGDAYRPHAAERRGRWTAPGEIDRLWLVALRGPVARVVAALPLGG